jgi:hypothetical protein
LRQLVLTAERTVTRAGDVKKVLTAELRLENAPFQAREKVRIVVSAWSDAVICPAFDAAE